MYSLRFAPNKLSNNAAIYVSRVEKFPFVIPILYIETADIFSTVMSIYQNASCHNLQENRLHAHFREGLTSE